MKKVNKVKKGKLSEKIVIDLVYGNVDKEDMWTAKAIMFQQNDLWGLFDGVIKKKEGLEAWQTKSNKKHINHKVYSKVAMQYPWMEVMQYLVYEEDGIGKIVSYRYVVKDKKVEINEGAYWFPSGFNKHLKNKKLASKK